MMLSMVVPNAGRAAFSAIAAAQSRARQHGENSLSSRQRQAGGRAKRQRRQKQRLRAGGRIHIFRRHDTGVRIRLAGVIHQDVSLLGRLLRADHTQNGVRGDIGDRADKLLEPTPEPLRRIDGPSDRLGGRSACWCMSLEFEGKSGEKLCIRSRRIERAPVGAGLKIADCRREGLELLGLQRLRWVSGAAFAFRARRETRFEGDVDGAVGVTPRQRSDPGLAGSELHRLTRAERLGPARIGKPWQRGIELHAVAPVGIENGAPGWENELPEQHVALMSLRAVQGGLPHGDPVYEDERHQRSSGRRLSTRSLFLRVCASLTEVNINKCSEPIEHSTGRTR